MEYSFKNGKLVLRDPDLGLDREETFRPGAKGIQKMWHPKGILKAETHYNKDGKLHGPSTFYSESGQILSEAWFLDGRQVGICRWFYNTGSLYSVQRFKDGLWHGLQEYFYPDGKPKTIMACTSGKLDGKVDLFAKDGSIERSLIFKNGKRLFLESSA